LRFGRIDELATLNSRLDSFATTHGANGDPCFFTKNQLIGLARPLTRDWKDALVTGLTPLGVVWVWLQDLSAAPTTTGQTISFACDLGFEPGANEVVRSFPADPSGLGWTKVDLALDGTNPNRSTVGAHGVTRKGAPKPATPPLPGRFQWKCLLTCAPSCATCQSDLKCWAICAGACLASCTIASVLD
jgi:hypothetical protein